VLAHENLSARKRAELEQLRLAAELRHRVKNTVAVVQSIARQTLRSDAPAAAETFHARLNALARAHTLLTEAGRTALDIGAVVEGALEPFRAREPAPLRVAGPELTLDAQAASTLTLVLHELATNAAKYGALSVPGGQVDVTWTTGGEAGDAPVSLTWQESGGPAVEPQPRRGFGSLMIERSIAHELGGRATLEFLPAGVRCRVEIPPAGSA
jgi:two-component sensor histidine kinase